MEHGCRLGIWKELFTQRKFVKMVTLLKIQPNAMQEVLLPSDRRER